MRPDLDQARRTALVAHQVVVRLKEMGLPDRLDAQLAVLSTDLGDLWGAQAELVDRLEGLLESGTDWESMGDYLVDIKATIDHMGWHAKSIRRPIGTLARFAYRKASETKSD